MSSSRASSRRAASVRTSRAISLLMQRRARPSTAPSGSRRPADRSRARRSSAETGATASRGRATPGRRPGVRPQPPRGRRPPRRRRTARSRPGSPSDRSARCRLRLGSSTATTSARASGKPIRKSCARASAAAPPEQPSAVIGSRRTSARKPSSLKRCASSDGIMIPVHDVVTIRSMSRASTPARGERLGGHLASRARWRSRDRASGPRRARAASPSADERLDAVAALDRRVVEQLHRPRRAGGPAGRAASRSRAFTSSWVARVRRYGGGRPDDGRRRLHGWPNVSAGRPWHKRRLDTDGGSPVRGRVLLLALARGAAGRVGRCRSKTISSRGAAACSSTTTARRPW